jgi:hypothetical protein
MPLCRRLQLLIDKLKQSKDKEFERHILEEDCCSETDTEGNDHFSESSRSSARCSQDMSKSNSSRLKSVASVEELSDDVPLISLLQSNKDSPKTEAAQLEKHNIFTRTTKASPKSVSKSTSNQQTVGRKRVRLILSDDENDMPNEVVCSKGRPDRGPVEAVATSDECGFKVIY